MAFTFFFAQVFMRPQLAVINAVVVDSEKTEYPVKVSVTALRYTKTQAVQMEVLNSTGR